MSTVRGVITLSQTAIRARNNCRGLKLTFHIKFLTTADISVLLATEKKIKSTLWFCRSARQITGISEIKHETQISKELYYFLFFNHCVWPHQKKMLQWKL